MSARTTLCIAIVLSAPASFAQTCPPFWADYLNTGPNGAVYCLLNFDDDGPGPRPSALYVGGSFNALFSHSRNGVQVNRIARWSGGEWSTLSGDEVIEWFGSGGAFALAEFDEDGDGTDAPRLFVGGTFRSRVSEASLLRWDGQQFTPVGTGLSGYVGALLSWDEDGPGALPTCLYVFGYLRMNAQLVHGVLKWDGAAWSVMPFPAGWDTQAFFGGKFAVFDEDGGGPGVPHLYFTTGIVDNGMGGLARWNGTAWEIVGGGLSAPFHSDYLYGNDLCEFDPDADGPVAARLYVSGDFTLAGDQEVRGIAGWDGQSWSNPGPLGVDALFYGLHVFDADGDGPGHAELFATGEDGALERWNGSTWNHVGDAPSFGTWYGWDMETYERGGISSLMLVGRFQQVYGITSFNIAELVQANGLLRFGDLNESGAVDLADLGILLTHFGAAEPLGIEYGDLDIDGDIDIRDLVTLLGSFGDSCL